jgi:S1-C subfamily serine protease
MFPVSRRLNENRARRERGPFLPRGVRAGALVAGLFAAFAPLSAQEKTAAAAERNPGEAELRRSVVKIYTTRRGPDLFSPWRKAQASEVTGSGAVIEGKRVLTNAHVAMHASQILLQGNESSDRVEAEVEAIAPEMDLAILKLKNKDEAFLENRPPIPFAPKRPRVKDAVQVIGYPVGGTSQSTTQGIVSRIEFAEYSFGSAGVRIQIDAPVNPGNSGGPAIVDGKLVGVVFSRLREADNIGYLIPVEEIAIFFNDLRDGRYDGKPIFFDGLQTLENQAVRDRLGLTREQTGVMCREPVTGPVATGLAPLDVITNVAGQPVDNLGLVPAGDGLRFPFPWLFGLKPGVFEVPGTVLRGGKSQQVTFKLQDQNRFLIRKLGNGYPDYTIYGPLVFSPASQEMTGAVQANPQAATLLILRKSPLVTRRTDIRQDPDEELVIVSSRMLPHPITKGYSDPFLQVVREVDGTPIRNLKHLVETLSNAKGEFVEIRFAERATESLFFRRSDIVKHADSILEDNGIRSASSRPELKIKL